MKRYLLLLILLMPHMLVAQSNTVADFFERYSVADGFSSVQLESTMMRMMSRQAFERGDRELGVLLEDIRYIRIIALKSGDGEMFVRAAEEAVAGDRKFRPVTSGTADGQTTKFFIRSPVLSMLSELVMITYGPNETVVVDIYGVFDLQQVTRLSAIRPQ